MNNPMKSIILCGGIIATVFSGTLIYFSGERLDVSECQRVLRSAQVKGITRFYPPIGYDVDGRPAIMLSSMHNHTNSKITVQDMISITQSTECVMTGGKRTDTPINIVWDDQVRGHIYRYNGYTLK